MAAGDVDVTEDAGTRHAPSLRARRLVAIGAFVVGAACLVSVVAAAQPDEVSTVRSPSGVPVAEPDRIPTAATGRSSPSPRPSDPWTTPSEAVAARSTSAAPSTATTTTTTTPVPTAAAAPASTTSMVPIATTTTPPAPPNNELVARPTPPALPSSVPAGPASVFPTRTMPGGQLATDVGCASGTSAGALDAFFRRRIGPVIGHDYQHVYPLGGDRRMWLFQDTFLDHTGNATRLDQAAFAHNTAMLQVGLCFTLLHRGTVTAPQSFETGTGEQTLDRWLWPLGGELSGGRLSVFWAEMVKTADPLPPDGLGWVPAQTWLATYDATTLARLSFRRAPASGTHPIYGFAVASDAEHTYLFGNTFDQNLARQGGYHACPCSATAMYLARVPRGRLDAPPEYRTHDGWSSDAGDAVPIVERYHAENPMQPRFVDGRWVAATKVDGYWGDELAIDVAADPWGPWTTTSRLPLPPRAGDPLMNTYHAHLLPWLDGGGLVVSVSQNARDMLRDAWPRPDRYRLQFLATALPPAPAPPPPPTSSTTSTSSTTTAATTTTSSTTTTTSSTTTTTSSTTTTTLPPETTTTSLAPVSSTSSSTSSTSTTTTTTAPVLLIQPDGAGSEGQNGVSGP